MVLQQARLRLHPRERAVEMVTQRVTTTALEDMNMLHIWSEKGGGHDTQNTMANEDAHEQLCLPDRRSPWRLAPFLAVACTSLQALPQPSPSAAGPSSCTLDPLKAVSPLACLVYRQLYSLHHAPSVWPLLHIPL